MIDQAALAAWDQGIGNTNAAISNLDAQRKSGESTIDTQTATALALLLGGWNQAKTAYDQNVTDTKLGYVGAKNTIGSNAGNSLNGILRLLGSKGVSGTDTRQVAPGAVTRMATQQRGEASNNFGSNMRSLDTGWNNYDSGYKNQVSSVNTQATNSKEELNRNINNNRATLLQTLANQTTQRAIAAGGGREASVAAAQPYLDQANQLLASSSNYTTKAPTYDVAAWQAPDLASYSTGAITPQFNGQTQGNDYTSPYLAALMGDSKNKPKQKQG